MKNIDWTAKNRSRRWFLKAASVAAAAPVVAVLPKIQDVQAKTDHLLKDGEELTGVVLGPGCFVAVGSKGTIFQSENGITWTERTIK